MSELISETDTFLSLFDRGQVTADQVDDFIDAWHDSGDQETCGLAEFLGMTDAEYGVYLMAPRALPLIVQARREGQPLKALLRPWLASLAEANEPRDKRAIFSLTHYLAKPDPA